MHPGTLYALICSFALLLWGALAIYGYLGTRRRRREQAAWDQLCMRYARLDRELDRIADAGRRPSGD